jgi:hypothetical protein
MQVYIFITALTNEQFFMTTERRPQHCASCGKEMREMRDWPWVEVYNVIIRDVTPEILREKPFLAKDDELVAKIIDVVESEAVQEFLQKLSATKISLITPTDLSFGLSPDEWVESRLVIPNTDFFLTYKDKEHKEQDGVSVLILLRAGIPLADPLAELAEVRYKGRFLNEVKTSVPGF